MFTNYYSYLLDNFQRCMRYTNAVIELNKLSDEDLNLLGLTRGEIPTEVYKTYLKYAKI